MSKGSGLDERLSVAGCRDLLIGLYGTTGTQKAAERMESLAGRLEARGAGHDRRFYSAPGRTELGGNHTDHNRGRVLAAAVDLDALACAAPRGSGDLRASIRSEGWPEPIVVDLSDLEPRIEERGRTEALVRGVARGLHDLGIAPRGFDAEIQSNVLPGSGLSSSAAIEVLFGLIMADLAAPRPGISALDPIELARIGQFAENRFFGKPCGLMDQMASAIGGISLIDFADPAKPLARDVAFDFAAAGLVLALVDTGGSHADLTAEYASIPSEMHGVAAFLGKESLREVPPGLLFGQAPAIRKACGDRAFLRALHFAAEDERVPAMARALERRDLGAYLGLVRASGDSSWRLLQNLYPPDAPREQGLPVALALSEGFLGGEGAARVHGGGFAGTIQAYVPLDRFGDWKALMERHFGAGAVIPISIRQRGALRIR